MGMTYKNGKKAKYKQPHNLREYDEFVRDRVHNALKHNNGESDLKKYQVYLKPARKKNNGHKSKQYRRS